MEFKLPKPIDAEENKLFLASKITVQRLKEDGNVTIPKDGIDYVWNQYFWAVFEHRYRTYNTCKGIVKQMFMIMNIRKNINVKIAK